MHGPSLRGHTLGGLGPFLRAPGCACSKDLGRSTRRETLKVDLRRSCALTLRKLLPQKSDPS